jgi:hypothetical protein
VASALAPNPGCAAGIGRDLRRSALNTSRSWWASFGKLWTGSGQACLTLRENTERPVTVTQGTNIIVGNDPERIVSEALAVPNGEGEAGRMPELWDGQSAERIVSVLEEDI